MGDKEASVKVEQGWLEGEVLDVITGDSQYYSFKGVPYATPPIGKLRFKAPLPPQAWEGIRKAISHGPVCLQKDIFSGEIIPGSEDCLYLNVYTPNLNPEASLAVMVFIHGGGYKIGSGNDDSYSPDFLVQHNVVVVTINYRLDALGFLCLDTEEVSGNAGMKDQVAALKWVQKNITHFGGDPDNVTIFGESAGGACVSMHIISPMSKGLFKRAVSMSGVANCDWSLPFEPRKRAFALGKLLGIQTENPDELLEFLQNVPAEDLVGTNPCVLKSEEIICNAIKMFQFVPVVEKNFGQDRFLTKEPLQALRDNDTNEVDVIIGYTDMECIFLLSYFEDNLIATYNEYGEMLVPRKILLQSVPEKILEISDLIRKQYFGEKPIGLDTMKEFIKYTNDATFSYQVQKFLQCLAEHSKNNLYLYHFACTSERSVYGLIGEKYGLSGASHLDDLMYLFHAKKFDIPVNKNLPSYKMVENTCALFTNFAKYGNPTLEAIEGVTWPLYNNESQEYLRFADKLIPEKALEADVIEFWKKVYEVAGVTL